VAGMKMELYHLGNNIRSLEKEQSERDKLAGLLLNYNQYKVCKISSLQCRHNATERESRGVNFKRMRLN